MRLSTSYKQILSLSVPIMLGSAAQNIIVLSDSVFLYHYDRIDFATSGLVGVFYLIIAAIGYGFSRGGQILIARRNGEKNYIDAGNDLKVLFAFELLLSIMIYALLYLGSPYIFKAFVTDPAIYEKCLAYIYPRSLSIFFSYTGVALIAFYTGIARTNFIIYDTLILIVVNLALNYILVFGHLGFPAMGIAGAAWASSIAEVVAFIAFVLYMFRDKLLRKYHLLKFIPIHWSDVKDNFSVSMPIVFQSILGIGAWFLFFSFLENVGAKELEISNLLRTVYLILSIPTWGYSAGINTMVSSFIGNKKRQAVLPLILKTIKINLATTALLTIPVVLFPQFFLYPLFGRDDMTLIMESKPYLPVMGGILATFAVGSILLNGLIGTGHTKIALYIQTSYTLIYIVYIVFMIKINYYGLNWAWGVEILYWVGIAISSYLYLKSNKWYRSVFRIKTGIFLKN